MSVTGNYTFNYNVSSTTPPLNYTTQPIFAVVEKNIYKCEICGIEFDCVYNKKAHQKIVHIGEIKDEDD